MASASQAEVVFVVDVTSLTEKGFTGTTKYESREIQIEFDDGDAGVFLTSEMAGRLHVRKGSKLSVVIEDEKNEVFETTVAGLGKAVRVSNAKAYYGIGRVGGAVIRLRKG